MDVMQTDWRSTRFVPTSPETYPQFDNLNGREIVITPIPDYVLMQMVQPPLKKASPSFIASHLRMLVSLSFLAMIGISLIGTSTLGGGTTLQHLIQGITLFSQSQTTNQNISLAIIPRLRQTHHSNSRVSRSLIPISMPLTLNSVPGHIPPAQLLR